MASYYGCLFVRPQEILGRQEQENPQEMDMVVNALGAGCGLAVQDGMLWQFTGLSPA